MNMNFLDGKTQTIKDIIENKNETSQNIINSKKPLIILGEVFFKYKISKLFISFF
jgi:hypothetical protein